MNPYGGYAAGYGEAQNRVGNVNQGQARPGQARTVKCYNCNGTGHIAQENGVALDAEQLHFLAGRPDNAFDDNVDEQPVKDLELNVDNVFQAEDCDAFDSGVDEASTAQTMFMANLSSADPITNEAGPSYDSDIMSEEQDYDQYLDDTCAYQEEHVMHDNVQLDHVVDLHADHTSIGNMIPYDQYVKDNDVSVLHSNASAIPNDTFMMIYDDMCEPFALFVSNSSRNAVVKNSLTAELATYREQVELFFEHEIVAQPTLYNGYEILKENHAWDKVHNTEDTLEIAKFTKKKMNAKMTDPKCVTHKVKIAPHDYSKENLLATFTPQKQLTPEQIYWSNDLMKFKSEALKEWAKTGNMMQLTRKNLLIVNDNLIAECLSKEVFSGATKSELNVARFAEIYVANTSVEARCLALEAELATLRDKSHQENQGELIKQFSKFENDRFRAENDKVKQHYKQLYDSIKITRAKHIEQVTKLTAENVTLKTSVSHAKVQHLVPTRTKHAVDVELIVHRLRNNRDAHLDYLRHLKESVETICDIVKEAKVVRPLDRSIVSACRYTQHSYELLEPDTSIRDTMPLNKVHSTTSGCSKHMTGDRSRLLNFVKKVIGIVQFGNDHFGAIMGYGDYVVGKSVISRHRRLNHLNFGTINDHARKDLVRGLPRLKFKKDHICFACQLGKSKKHTHKPKAENTNFEVLNTLHMDLCSPMRVQTINGKKYILVIVDDYSRFTWVEFLRSKDETPKVVIKFITQIQDGLNKTVRYVHTDNGTEFVNHTMTDYYERIGIFHQKTVSRTPQQNGVVERQNRTLVEVARTMLIFSKASMFLWAEAVATACYTQNRSLIYTRHHKNLYELVHNKKPDLTFFRVFGKGIESTTKGPDVSWKLFTFNSMS
nr:putative ribonuclease H-like domain-containing protein [Tanacetum cinerariifolium]